MLGSGIAIMSDSSIGLKPVIEEPSKPIPPSNASPSSVALIENDFSCPRMSVNHSRMKRMSRSCDERHHVLGGEWRGGACHRRANVTCSAAGPARTLRTVRRAGGDLRCSCSRWRRAAPRRRARRPHAGRAPARLRPGGTPRRCAADRAGSRLLDAAGQRLRSASAAARRATASGPAGHLRLLHDAAASGRSRSAGVDRGLRTQRLRRRHGHRPGGRRAASPTASGAPAPRRPHRESPGAESYQSVDSIVVKADGAVALDRRRPHSIIGHRARTVVEVRPVRRARAGAARQRTGHRRRRSLRLHGSRLSWRHGSASRALGDAELGLGDLARR